MRPIRAEKRYPAKLVDRDHSAVCLALAMRKAKALAGSEDVGRTCVLGWPMLWMGDEVIVCGPARIGADGVTMSELPATMETAQAKSMLADMNEEWLCLCPDDEYTIRTRATIMAAPRLWPNVPTLPDAPNTVVEEWLVDTGCGHGLVDKGEISVKEAYLQESGEKVIFATAGGEILASKVIPLYVPELKQSVKPYVLNSTPNVLSVGLRCQQIGWKFVWEPYSNRPYLKDPYGHIVYLVTRGNTPYLVAKSPAMALAPRSASVSAGLYGASVWAKVQRRPAWLSAGLDGASPVSPWPEERNQESVDGSLPNGASLSIYARKRTPATTVPNAVVVPSAPAPEVEADAAEEAEEDQHRGMSESQLRMEAVSIGH